MMKKCRGVARRMYTLTPLKIANICMQCDIKLCDFGLARYVDPSEVAAQNMTEYVVTRWYRAPELLLSFEEYTAAIDMWSAGCVIAELYSRRPIFPGQDVKNQLEVICQILGKPSPSDIKSIPNRRARDFIARLPEYPKVELRRIMKDACNEAVDLVSRMLRFDPTQRISASQALEHRYVHEYRSPGSETSGVTIDFDALEPPSEKSLGREGVRRMMWDEMLHFHPEARAREPAQAKEAEKRVQMVMRNVGNA